MEDDNGFDAILLFQDFWAVVFVDVFGNRVCIRPRKYLYTDRDPSSSSSSSILNGKIGGIVKNPWDCKLKPVDDKETSLMHVFSESDLEKFMDRISKKMEAQQNQQKRTSSMTECMCGSCRKSIH
jgi:hypothetical protein